MEKHLKDHPEQFFERLILPIILRAKDDHVRLEMLQTFCTAAGVIRQITEFQAKANVAIPPPPLIGREYPTFT